MTGAGAAGYAYFEVEADVGVHAWAPTLAGALAQVARGVLALAVDPAGVVITETREVRAQGETPEALLVNWVNECLYVHEIEGFAAREVEVDQLAAPLVHGVLRGEQIDTARHRPGAAVRAATFRQASVVESPGRTEVRLVVDV